MSEDFEKFEINCKCGVSRDHLTQFQFFVDDPEDVIVGSGLNHYLPFWKRVVVGLKYIFGIDNTYCQYTESVVDKEEMVRLHDWIENVIVRMK